MNDDFWEQRQELDELRLSKAALTDRLQAIQKQLQPFYVQETHLKNRVIRTHHAVKRDDSNFAVRRLDLSAAARTARRDLWAPWDALHRDYAPLINERRYVISKGKEIAKQIAHIEAWIEKEKKRKRKH
jgi:hypothetical protein